MIDFSIFMVITCIVFVFTSVVFLSLSIYSALKKQRQHFEIKKLEAEIEGLKARAQIDKIEKVTGQNITEEHLKELSDSGLDLAIYLTRPSSKIPEILESSKQKKILIKKIKKTVQDSKRVLKITEKGSFHSRDTLWLETRAHFEDAILDIEEHCKSHE